MATRVQGFLLYWSKNFTLRFPVFNPLLMQKLFFLLLSVSFMLVSSAQRFGNQFKNLKSLEKELEQAGTPEEKTNAFISLYLYHASHSEPENKIAAKDYQQQLELYTHKTNQPELIARALHAFLFLVTGEELKKHIERLYNYAKLHDLPFYKARARIRESAYYFIFQSDLDKSARLLNEAITLSKDLDDSSQTVLLVQISGRYTAMNNHLQALQFAFEAQEIASKLKNIGLLEITNASFDEIYANLKDHHKALHYSQKIIQQLRMAGEHHMVALRHARAAAYFFMLDQPAIGNFHVKEAYRIADSIKGSKRLFNEITGRIMSALSLSNHNEVLIDFLTRYRQHFFIFPNNNFLDNVTLARAFAKTGNMDSARFLINKATQFLSANTSADQQRRYYYTLARIATYDKNWNQAAENYKNCLQITLAQNDLPNSIDYSDSLKNMLVGQGHLPEAIQYFVLSDSLKNQLNKQLDKEDITRQEVAAFEKEKRLQAVEKEKEKNQRHNVQYLGITFGVVALFVFLLLMGFLNVSPRTIRVLGFFTFLLFFEFIFLIFKKQITGVTGGEPLKDLGFMVLLAAIMVPLHHWTQHKAIEYLSSKKLSFPKLKTAPPK